MAKDVCIKAGSFCPVCRGLKGADCWHDASEFHSGSLYLNRVLELKDENEALREALREIEALEIDWRLSTAENMRAASRIARAALKVSGHD